MKKSFLLLAVSLTLTFSHAQNAALDNTFANNGILQISSAATSEINSVDIDFNQTIYSAATTSAGNGTGIYHLTVSKTSSTGILDGQFGTNGVSTISFEYSEYPLAIKVLNNAKILVCGSAYTGPTSTGPGLHIAFAVRLNPDGSLDSSFGTNGVLKLDNIKSHFTSIMPLNDNSIIFAGNINDQAALMKTNEDGVLDVQFGTNGTQFMSATNFNFLQWKSMVTSSDEILSVGYDYSTASNTKIAFCKVDLSGNFVNTFGTNGIVVMDLNNSMPTIQETLTAIREYGNDYYLAGQHMSSFMLRINESGIVDTTFGVAGILEHSYPFKDFDIQSDGKIIVGGSKVISTYNYGHTFVRFNNDGSLDSTFNNGNSFDIDISSNNDYVQSIRYFSEALYIGGSSYENGHAVATLVKLNLNPLAGIAEQINSTELNVYPNPFTDHFYISNSLFQVVELLDFTGRKLSIEQTGNKVQILESVDAGAYFMIAKDQKNNFVMRKLLRK